MRAKKSLQDTLFSIIHSMPDSPEKQLLEINLLWQQVTGSIIGANSRVQKLETNGVLLIELDDRGWIKPLSASESFILGKLNAHMGGVPEIKKLRFRISQSKTFPHPVIEEAKKRKHEQVDQKIREIAQTIPDEPVRDAFLKAYFSYPDG
jgi:hypothetical protein